MPVSSSTLTARRAQSRLCPNGSHPRAPTNGTTTRLPPSARHPVQERVHGILKRRGLKVRDENDIETTNLFTKKRREDLLRLNDQEIPTLLDLLDGINAKLRESDKSIRAEIDENHDLQLLCTIPGIGPITALMIYAEAGDITRFPSGEKFTAYFGLVPRETQSGEMLYRGHITKRGSSLARWALSQAAWQHVKHAPNSFITKKYRAISERAGKKRASIAVARMLAIIAYTLLKEQRVWHD